MIKRIKAFCMAIVLMLCLLPAAAFAAENACSVEFYDASDKSKIDAIGSQQQIYAKVKFTAPSDGDAVLVIAKYDASGALQTATIENAENLSAGTEVEHTTKSIDVSGTDHVKIFVWDGLKNLKPAASNYGMIKKEINLNASASATVNSDNGVTTGVTTITAGKVSASVPQGTKVASDTLTLTVTKLEQSGSGISVGESEVLLPIDIHVDGIAADNTVPVIVTVTDVLSAGLNKGNLALYHVEDGKPVKMTEVETPAGLTAHNCFHYDAATGTITLAMATFSEVAVVSDTEKTWEGNVAAAFGGGTGTEDNPYIIANADQLAYLGDRVSNDNEAYGSACYKLISDINFGGEEVLKDGKLQFYPIGYNSDGYKGAFSGTFDGSGHTVSNIYQNTWQLLGTYDGTYYNDAMGLFGYVYGGTVKNLTVDNFSSDGEFTPTGVIAAYAANSTFKNIAITDCNPRVYNTGNGGIVGVGGNSDDPETYKLTFENITIDNTNKITALWGSWDVACGGLVGMFRGAGHVYMTNCHVAAQIDVYNDVCGNYQYYWYRYSGMLIGTNKNMTTDENGYTVPETDKFHAENCTVHFGQWNDYYYCELVANSLASYTHDHQFSRLTQVDSVDAENMTVTVDGEPTDIPTSGRYNYVVVDGEAATENATCYHFVDGAVWNHADAGYETTDVDGDGVVDSNLLKEDRQHYYLPFNQLFTGYGWGVKHIPVYNGENYAFEGITILDREVADSVVKFETKAAATYVTGTSVTIGELFAEVPSEVAIDSDNVQITVSPVDDDSTAGGTYTADTSDWRQGTLTFTGLGTATITITDYYFCTPTTISVEVTEPASVEKFDLQFENTDKYLYRVGNANTVALGSLFAKKAGATINNSGVTVTIDKVNENTNVSGTFTANTSNWTKGTIQFSGTGPVKLTITDNDYCIPKELYLEVVDATNVTAYSGLSNQNSVLLNDVTMSSGSSYYLSNATLYGNGFTFDVTAGGYTGSSISNNYLVSLSNANLDNIEIIGAVYTEYGAQAKDNYNRATVFSVGNNTITNSYISNCAAPVRVNGGNIEIINTTLKGGNFANIDIRNGHVVLEDVTTINQSLGNDKSSAGTTVVGLGVVIYYENVLETTTVEIRGTLKQYNHISDNDTFSSTYAKELVNVMLGSDHSDLQLENNGVTWANAGIVSMTDGMNDNIIDSRSDKGEYTGKEVSFQGVNGYVYTMKPTETSIIAEVPEYITAGQGAIAPNYSFDYTTKNYIAKTDGSNDYCYEDNGTVIISMDSGESFSWDTTILTATKNGQTLDYTVSMNDTDYTGKKIAFTEAGNYEVIYTYTDDNNFSMDSEKNIATYSKNYTKTVHISVVAVKPDAKNAEFTFGSDNIASKKLSIGNDTYVMPDVSATSSTIGSTTASGQTIYYPIVEMVMSDGTTSHSGTGWQAYFPVFSGTVTITDYADGGIGDAITYNSSTTSLPSGLSIVGDPSTLFKYQSSSSAGTTPVVKNNILVYVSPTVSAARNEYNLVVQYSYMDNAGTTYYYYIGYHAPAQTYNSICVTPDTLVTLADGSKKEIRNVSVGEDVIAWNFHTGEYEVVPVSLCDVHSSGYMNVLHLYFDDGTELKVLGEHGIFDSDLNNFIFIDKDDVTNYLGHSFVKQDGSDYKTVKLVDYKITEENTQAYTIMSSEYHNVILEDMFTLTPAHVGDNFFNPFEIGEDMKYDSELVKADIEKYGLYTYEDFAHVLTYEQFKVLNIAPFKVAVGKGLVTYEGLIYLIENFINR